MAWTTPASWSVGELIAASKMNTHIRDNFNYLKGSAGVVDIGTTSIVSGINIASSWSASEIPFKVADQGGYGIYVYGRNEFNFDHGQNADTTAAFNYHGYNAGTTRSRSLWFCDGKTNPVFVIDGVNKRVGVGTTGPLGKFHVYDTISGFLKWEYDGLDNVARTVIADAAGDVLYGMQLWSLVRHSAAGAMQTAHSGGTVLSTGVNYDIYNSGGNVAQIQLAANGSVTVQRTAGTGTYKVCLLMQWL